MIWKEIIDFLTPGVQINCSGYILRLAQKNAKYPIAIVGMHEWPRFCIRNQGRGLSNPPWRRLLSLLPHGEFPRL